MDAAEVLHPARNRLLLDDLKTRSLHDEYVGGISESVPGNDGIIETAPALWRVLQEILRRNRSKLAN